MAALTLALAASLACSAAAAAPPAAAAATSATFSNIEPRRDTHGQIIDAHDGNYQLVNGTWHYFAMGYGLCNDTGTVNGCDPKCGYSPANTVNVWTSPDLSNSNWTKLAEVLPYAERNQLHLLPEPRRLLQGQPEVGGLGQRGELPGDWPWWERLPRRDGAAPGRAVVVRWGGEDEDARLTTR